ncbi:MAG TPA: NfeD family protein [Thermoanaerobaculia bacterium]|nr:NfeD family protein [Thermoanaerobaculia bacterium]
MVWWIWVLIGLLLLSIEFVSSTMHLGLFAVGAFVVAILVAVGIEMPLWVQLVLFTVISIVSLLFIRPVLVKKLRLSEKKQIDTLVGEQAMAMEDIAPATVGKAELRGTTWSARNIGEVVLVRGQRCVVAHVDGLTIHVRAS